MSPSSRVDRDPLIFGMLDSVGDDAKFTTALESIGKPLGARVGHAFVIRKADGALIDNVTYADSDHARFEQYEIRFRATDPRFITATNRPDEVHSDVAVVDASEFERSGLYNENLKPAGVRYTLFGTFSISPELLLPIAFMRSRALGGFQADDVAYMSDLMPSVGRAFRLHEMIRSLVDENRDLREMLDRMPSAVAIIGPDGRIRCTNAAASVILSRADGLCTRGGVLSAAHPDDARRLAGSILAGSCAPTVRVRRQHGSPLDVVFLPISQRSTLHPPGHMMVVIYDPDRAVTLDEALVARLHGLTATEAEIAVSIAAGKSLTNIAAQRNCSEETVRTHLKRIFAKMGVARQTELVRVLLTGPAIHLKR